ncbi:MAG: hypothetical protein N3B13_06710, partial [Deltaproteobacteria bacterium]|nr:hypothetical protein [Deltaproteobacteria bacterium]
VYKRQVQGKSENNIIYANTTMPVIMWNPSSSSDTEYYEIQIKRDIDTNYMSFKVYGQNFIPPSLSERRYNFRIRTFDKSGRSSNYAIGPDFIIDTTVPTTPRFEKINYSIVDLNDSDYNELKIRLAVLSSDTNFKEYKIKGGVYSEFIPVQPDNYNYVKFYLLKDSVNNLQIKAVDRAGNESSTDYIVITEDSRVPLPPSDIRVIEGNGRIYVKWTPSASKDVAGYRLYYGFTDKPPFAGSFAAEGVSPINAGLNTVIGLSYLINFTKFYVTVTAYDKTENIFHESIMPQAVPVYPTPISIEPAGKYTENHKALKLYFYEDNLLLLDGEGIRFYDITEPTKPIITGKYNDNEPISSIGHYSCKPPCKPKGEIYLGKSGYIDIIEIKNGAHLKSRIATAHLHTFIFVYQDYLISAIDRDGFKVYSYTDENSLEELGSFEAGKIITSAYLKDDYLFYVETTDYSKYMLHITDISDPLNVKKVSSFKIGGYSKWINIVNNRLYTAYPSTEFLKDEMLVLDISDLKNPKMLGTYKGNMMNMGDADGSYVFLLDSTDGLVILDQSRLPDFQKVTSLNRFNLATDIKARSNFLYISDDYNGLAVVDVSNVYQPSVVFSEKFDRFEPSDVAVQGAYAYLSNKTPPKIVILDISNPGNIKKKGELPLSNSPEGLFIHGNELYIANGTKGLTIADVSEPLSPKIIGNLGNITISRVYYSNGYVFALGVNSFYSIDVKNPKTPVLKGSITTLTDPKKFVVRGRVAYIADGSGGLKAVNLNNTDSPVLATTFSNGANIVDVLISGKKIIIAEESGLRILEVNNISNPTTFNQLGNFRINGITNTIAMSGPYVYLLGSVSGLWIIDINNPQANLLCPDSQYCKGFLEIPS